MPRAWACWTASAIVAAVTATAPQGTGPVWWQSHSARLTPGQYADATYQTGPAVPDS
jgi:hypothetical protein